jgi:hypothetical protein
MHFDHQAKIVQWHFGEGLVSQDASVIDKYVDTTPCLHGPGNHIGNLIHVGYVRAMCHRLAAGCLNLGSNCIRVLGVAIGSAEVIHHDFRATLGQRQCMATPKPLSRAANDRYLAI